MKKGYGYVRVSTDKQVEHGYGLETQENAIRKHCEENNIELENIFYDKGITGKIDDEDDDLSVRPGLQELLCSLNGINTIIVMNTSRLWRNDTAKVLVVREVKKLKGEIISIEQPRYSLYSKDPSDVLFNGLMELLDEYERMNINLRLAKGLITKAKQGNKPAGRQPFGYEYSYDRKSTIINESQAKIVKDIFKMRANNKSLNQIADRLNRIEYYQEHKEAYADNKGYKGKYKKNTGQGWTNQSVRKILTNDFYIGIVTYAEEKIKGNHKPIIDMNLWNKVNGLS